MYAVLKPEWAVFPAAWSKSVDLPIPGSPPTNIAEPGTRPPPVTLSSSEIPDFRRGTSMLSPLRLTKSIFLLFLLFGLVCCVVVSSNKVFHSPQLSHLPAHLV